MFWEKRILRQRLLFDEVTGLQTAILLKKRLSHIHFLNKYVKILRSYSAVLTNLWSSIVKVATNKVLFSLVDTENCL